MTQVFTMHFICSVEDKPFKVRFERENESSLFTIASTKRAGSISPGQRSNKTGDTQSSFSVNEEQLSFDGFHCPWCQHGAGKKSPLFIECDSCKQNICGGNSGRIRFRCRSSCGNKGLMLGINNFTSYLGSLSHSSAPEQLLSSSSETKQLTHSSKTTGTSLIVRD